MRASLVWPLMIGGLSVLIVTGCGGQQTGTVRGKVLFKGQPVTAGHVTFMCDDGRVASGPITKEGTYLVQGAPVGENKILVDSTPPPDIVLKEPPGKLKRPGGDDVDKTVKPAITGPYVPIPERYKHSNQSDLKYKVQRGDNEHDIVLVP